METPQATTVRTANGSFILGAILLVVAAAASLMMALQHIAGLALPGCGVGSACALLSNGPWGSIPGLGWPVSHVGLAYFLAQLVAWIMSRGGLIEVLRWLARLGVAASLLFVLVMISQKHICYYCLTTHAANFAFWILLEATARPQASASMNKAPVGFAAVFCIATLGLVLAETSQRETVRQAGEMQLAESTQQIIRKEGASGGGGQSISATETPKSASQLRWPGGFTGRHRLGPERAPIRIVLLSDFQCPDCKRTEQDIRTMLAARNDVSVSFRHFPMCKDCNKYLNQTLHANACWAARAAEAAAIVGGEDGFWKMHRWLFDREGKFETTEILLAGVREMGLEPTGFVDVMTSPETLKRVEEDVEDGQWLGLFYTPMVFINGVELKGVFTPGAVPRAVEIVAAQKPHAAGCENDFPVPALQKYLDDWREKPLSRIPPAKPMMTMGAASPKVRVVMWGDLAEPNSAKLDALVREFVGKRTDAGYEFRHFPVNKSCNPSCQVTRNETACLGHKSAIAAGLLGGPEGYWKMHKWIMQNQGQLTNDSLWQAASAMGFDAAALLQRMESPDVADVIAADAALGKRYNLTAVPFIFINGKQVPRWLRGAENLLPMFLEEATK